MDEGLEDSAHQEDCPHRRSTPSEPVQLQRYQDGKCAEEQGGEPYEPQAGKQQGLAYRSERRQQGDITGGKRCLLQGGPAAVAPPTNAEEGKAGKRPTVAATLPSTGPRSAPTTAALTITPIISARRSSGARSTSQVNAATHESALPNPPANRTATSSHAVSTSANITLVTDIRINPTRAVIFTPEREARYPPGTLPTRTPAP